MNITRDKLTDQEHHNNSKGGIALDDVLNINLKGHC